ncbi:MAG: hypothetical protein LBL66_03135 [Clostridiales bacterium]|jgi:hypothetical protein|nr:hypothetical protein [Clostridiales bacterium]
MMRIKTIKTIWTIRKGLIAAAACALAVALCVGGLPARGARAGVGGAVIANDAMTFSGGEINTMYWRYGRDRGVGLMTRAQDAKKAVKFGGTSSEKDSPYTESNPLIARQRATMSTGTDLLTASFTLRVVSVAAGVRFGFVFALPRLTGDAGDAGSYLLYVENDGGYKWGLCWFDGAGSVDIAAPSPLPSPIKTGLAATDFAVSLTATGAGALTVSLNGAQVLYDTVAGANFTGYTGFAAYEKIGGTGVGQWVNAEAAAPLYIYNSCYERAQTPLTVAEDFDRDDFDAALWQIGGELAATGGKLVFSGATGVNSFFGSKYSYSNFELAFSLSDFRNTPVSDPYASLGVRAATAGIAVAFGYDVRTDIYYIYDDVSANGYTAVFDAPTDAATGARAGATGLTLYYRGAQKANVVLEGSFAAYDFLNWADTDKRIDVKMNVEDGVFIAGLCAEGEEGYTEILRCGLEDGLTPIGQVALFGRGDYGNGTTAADRFSEYALDGITLTNTDLDPDAIPAPARVSSKKPVPGDAAYTDAWSAGDLLENRIGGLNDGLGGENGDGGKGNKTGLYIGLGVGAAALACGIVWGCLALRNKRRKSK